ncbi:hypothetical protein CMT75_12345 [Elizabethkingia anophelis]|uniref:hypothetical protein n=1 Tax=Elizabethkingia anophelis TaxID=1117645 RepID=UPI0024E0ED5E|nr:hypothetical protein [Elizabethkingia anophelis]MCT4306016.1 hypothetical protein [Elizabethkingia anophelis]MDV3540991.1 hypothetical protein [Elizabethkingia anophelis]MDV3949303.1 hypothetical protein [Elizabethkingia anophelis]HDP3255751.1 hypothetical protein [Elizabethkingia anophelis]
MKHQKEIHKQKSINRNKRRLKTNKKKKFKLKLFNGIKKSLRRRLIAAREYIVVKCPENFSFINNTNDFCCFIKRVEFLKNNCGNKGLLFNMWKCNEIDFSGLSVLFLMLYNLKLNNIKINGFSPENIYLRLYLEGMKFFETLIMIQHKYENIEYNLGENLDRITIKGDSLVKSELGLEIGKYLSRKLFKDQIHVNEGLQIILLELMSNTTTWSNQSIEKNLWILTIYYNKEENKMYFAFADYGVGILKSIKGSVKHSEWLRSIIPSVMENTDCSIFKSMLDGNSSTYRSSTGHYYRGKGIPSLKKALNNNYIKDLSIITNGVYSNVDLGVFEPIENDFSGAFITWAIDTENNFYLNEEIFN